MLPYTRAYSKPAASPIMNKSEIYILFYYIKIQENNKQKIRSYLVYNVITSNYYATMPKYAELLARSKAYPNISF